MSDESKTVELAPLTPEAIAELSPGIRGAVLWLRSHGFDTCDSGDGSNAAAGMECAVDYPMIAIRATRETLLDEADRCAALLQARGIPTVTGGGSCSELTDSVQVEASYVPGQSSVIILVESGDKDYLASIPVTP